MSMVGGPSPSAAYRLSWYLSRMKVASSGPGLAPECRRKPGGSLASQYLLAFVLPMQRTNSICLGSQVSSVQERTCMQHAWGVGRGGARVCRRTCKPRRMHSLSSPPHLGDVHAQAAVDAAAGEAHEQPLRACVRGCACVGACAHALARPLARASSGCCCTCMHAHMRTVLIATPSLTRFTLALRVVRRKGNIGARPLVYMPTHRPEAALEGRQLQCFPDAPTGTVGRGARVRTMRDCWCRNRSTAYSPAPWPAGSGSGGACC